MQILWQLAWASAFLVACLFIHIVVLVKTIEVLNLRRRALENRPEARNWTVPISIVLGGVLLGHTIQIWAFATLLFVREALPTFEVSMYFALVTYTTVGYGDVTLDDQFRIFAAMGSVTGLLAFGLSTAMLVGVFTEMFTKNRV